MRLGFPWSYGLSCAYIIMGLFLLILQWEEVSLGSPCGSGMWQRIKGYPPEPWGSVPLHDYWSRLFPHHQAQGSLR